MVKRLAGYLLVFCSVALAQPEPVPLRVTRILGITTTTVIDNRNEATRQNDMHTFCATGSGTWSVKIQYSNTASTGPWSDFPNSFSSVSNASSACTGLAYGNYSWVRLLVSGTATTTYSAVRQFYIPTEFLSSGTVLASLNGLTASSQSFATGTSGSDFNIVSSGSTHTFHIPTASGSVRGLLSSSDFSVFTAKQSALVNSAGLRGALNDETGGGPAVFGTGPTLDLPSFGVYAIGSTLPAAGTANRLAMVTNGSSLSDCTAGGGSTWVLCVDTGSVWVHPGGSGSSAWSSITGNPFTSTANGVRLSSADALYFEPANPSLGFNAYYNSGWKFGNASPNNYAAVISRDSSGNLLFSVSSATGAVDAAVTFNTMTFNQATRKLSGVTPGTATGEVVSLNGSNQVDLSLIPDFSASKITSGTLSTARGGLGADVSAFDGLLRMNAGTAEALGLGTCLSIGGGLLGGDTACMVLKGAYSGAATGVGYRRGDLLIGNTSTTPDANICLADNGTDCSSVIAIGLTTGAKTAGKQVTYDANGKLIVSAYDVGAAGGSSSGEYSGTIDFSSIPDGSCREGTFTATGATTSMIVQVGLPAAIETGLLVSSWISAADTAKVRACNFSGGTPDPVNATYKVKSLGSLGLLTGSGTIDIGPVPDGSCLSGTFTVTGAATGDHVTPGWPSALETGLIGVMFVSSANTVTVRECNFSGTNGLDPASATFKAAIVK